MQRQMGVNLIELMIVVVIIAILSAFAYPAYTRYVENARRADCTGGLAGLANAMERHYSINGSYLAAAAGGADTGAPAVFATACPIDGGTPTYNLTISAATVSTFTLQAAPTGPQAGDRCGTLTLTNPGLKGVQGATAGNDWETCWR